MGLSAKGFYKLTPRQFANKLTGFRRAQEMAMREGWQQTRLIVWASLKPYQEKGKNLKAEDILSFPWEKQPEEAQVLSLEEQEKEVQKVIEFYKELDAKRAKK